ncbi:MAG: 2-oxoacid:acceptor oxidoreductase family protein, partial [Planctomycetota bacterium]
VVTAETHGMAQRGAAVESHVKLGGFSASLVRRGRADAVLVLDAGRLEAARAFLRPGGRCFVNTAAAPDGAAACDAAGIAAEMGLERGANLLLLGFAAAAEPDLFPGGEALGRALERLSPPPARADNRRAWRRWTERDG